MALIAAHVRFALDVMYVYAAKSIDTEYLLNTDLRHNKLFLCDPWAPVVSKEKGYERK